MKKVFIILTALCIILNLSCAKKTKHRLLYLHYDNSSGEKGVTTFDYNEKGLSHRSVWELLDGSRFSLNEYAFDENGNQIRKYREFSDSLTSEQIFKYDENSNLIEETFERSDGKKGNTTYLYNENGIIEKAECNGLNGWIYGMIIYTTNSKGTKTKGIIVQKGDTTGTIDYTYNIQNNLIKEHWDFSGQWSQTFTYEYDVFDPREKPVFTSSNVFITNSNTYKIVKEHYDYNNKTGGPSFYTYDENGKLINKTFKRSDGLTTETTFLYNTRSILLKSYRKYSNKLHALFSYSYDVDGKLMFRKFNRSDGLSGSESYMYDDSGILQKAEYNNMDSWLTGIIDFSYTETDLLDRAVFKGKDGFGADISFFYDQNQNLVKIHWDFSFGKTLTYTFEYERIKQIKHAGTKQ